jgi:hypothetical protein
MKNTNKATRVALDALLKRAPKNIVNVMIESMVNSQKIQSRTGDDAE